MFIPWIICNTEELETAMKLLPHFPSCQIHGIQLFHGHKMYQEGRKTEKKTHIFF